jgi:hypothetical protein
MSSADQVPVKTSHLMMLWPKWVVLIAESTGAALLAVRPPNRYVNTGVFLKSAPDIRGVLASLRRSLPGRA